MQQEEAYEPPAGSAIFAGADLIMTVIANERAKASQTAETHLANLAQHLEQYKAWSQETLATEGARLVASHKRISELEQQHLHLQALKKEDELVIQNMSSQIESLKQERDYLHAELSSSLHNQRMATATSVDLISDLGKYDMWFWGANSLSFGNQWLQLWNQYVSEDPQAPDPGLSSDDRLTPKELAILLENFSSQVRRDKETIQTQHQTILRLQREGAYLFELCNGDSKSLSYSAPAETDLQTPESEVENSTPFSYSGNQDHYTGARPSPVKSESSIEFSNGPAHLFAPASRQSGGPS